MFKKRNLICLIAVVACLLIAFVNESCAETFGWPVPGYMTITTRYYYSSGKAHSCRYHNDDGTGRGIDIAVPSGTEVIAPASGTVQSLADLGGSSFGRYFEIKHDDGTITLYAHLSEFRVENGQYVNVGDVIALSGSTGNSTGPHLHFEMSNKDPLNYYNENGYTDPRNLVKPDLPWDGSYYLTGMTPSSYAHIYTLENKTYDVYSDKFLKNKLTQNWTDGTEEDYLIGVGKNSEGVYYAHISIPRDDGGRKNVYVNLKDVFIKGSIDEAPEVYYDTRNYHRRPGNDPDSSYYTKAGDTIFRLTNDNGWSQVAFWDNGTGCIRIAWLTNSEYQRIITPPYDSKIDSSNFPDSIFRQYVSNNFDKDKNGYLSESEIASVTEIKVANSGISSLVGIKKFVNLSWLECNNNKIRALDLSGLTKLTSVWCWENNMESLNVNGCSALPELWAKDNKLTYLNIDNCPKIEKLYLMNNNLTSLNLSNRSALKEIWVQNNKLSSLNVDNSSNLEMVEISNNSLTTFNLSNRQYLREIWANNNNFLKLDIRNLPSLKKLNFDGCNVLYDLIVYNTGLESLNVSNLKALQFLYCNNNKLTSINASNCTALGRIDCENNKITSINLSGCSSLQVVEADSGVIPNAVTPKGVVKPTITTTSMPNGQVGKTYNGTVKATGTGPIFYKVNASAISMGFLSGGEKLYSTSGIINGTPKNSYNNFILTIEASNYVGTDTKSFTINILPEGEAPSITTTSPLSTGTEGTSYNYTLSATGTTSITWSLYSGSLPKGLSLSSAGKISGTPTSADTYSFTLKASNNYGYDTKSFKLTINGVSPTITTTSPLTSGTEGKSYSFTPLATGTKAITWSKYSGTLPSGLSISSSTGTISGTPTSADTYSFTLKAANKWGSTTKTFKLTINGVAPTITTTSPLPFGTEGKLYNRQLEATGTAPITWSIYSGSLPSGLSLGSSTGIISGTTTTAGTYNFTVRASNKWGSINKTFELSVSEAPSVSIEVVSPGKFVGDYYEAKINANFSISSCTISSGSLPPNLTLKKVSDSQWAISGYLTKAGVFSFLLNVVNSTGSFTKVCSMIVEEDGIKIDQTNFPDATFRKYVSDNFDKDHNGYLNDEELAAVKNIDVDNIGISSLEGIEYFTELTTLSCNSNDIKELDLSDNTKLKYLYCNSNALTELILGENSALKYVDCQNNPDLHEVDSAGCPNAEIKHDTWPNIEKPSFVSHTLILDGQIGVNFYIEVPDGADYSDGEKYYMEFDIKGGHANKEAKQKYDPQNTKVVNGKTRYGYKCYISSAQMAENITATFHFNGETISTTSSVNNYLNLSRNYDFPETVRTLMDAIRDYGHYAQPMLAQANDWVVGDKYAEMPKATEYTENDISEVKSKVTQYAVSTYKNSSGIAAMSVNLNLDSETTLNVNCTLSSTYNGLLSAAVDGLAYDVTVLDGLKRVVKIANIPANELDKTYSVMLLANGGANTVNASALSYVNMVLNYSGSSIGKVDIDTMKKAVTALYRYHAAAKAYLGR